MKLTKIIKQIKPSTIIFLLLSIIFIIPFYSYCETFWLKINVIDIKDSDIPNSFAGKTIAFVSDIHHGPFLSQERVHNIVNKINSLKPDIILLGGDYVHRNVKYIKPCFKELSALYAPSGVYAVLGNHDHWESKQISKEEILKAGITLIDNKAKWIYIGSDRIKIGGVGDYLEDTQNIKPTINDVKENDFVILVSHNPDYAEEIRTNLIDLVLSGHTHGGQVSLFGMWSPILPSKYGQKYRYGIVETSYCKVIVTSGVGTITPPLRFCVRPEIVLLTLKHSD